MIYSELYNFYFVFFLDFVPLRLQFHMESSFYVTTHMKTPAQKQKSPHRKDEGFRFR